MPKKSDSDFHESIKKLKSLRERLCSQSGSGKEAFKTRDFVISELQDMHEKLNSSDDVSPAWCKQKVEHILTKILDVTHDEGGDKSDV